MEQLQHDTSPLTVTRSEERLHVGTEHAPSERVRVRKRIVEEVRQVQVTVRREELEVVRTPLAAAEGAVEAVESAQGLPLVLVLSEEVPVVSVQTRPYERVTVSLEQVDDVVTVREQVASERIEVLPTSSELPGDGLPGDGLAGEGLSGEGLRRAP